MSADAGGGPAEPERILVAIRSALPSLPRAERRVAQATLDDPAGAAALTISALARRCSTSETTVVRLCRSLGLKGYPELRVALAAAGGRAGAETGSPLGSDIGPDDDVAGVVAKLCFADAKAIEETGAQLDVGNLTKAAEAVIAARRVDIYGVGASAIVGLDLQQKLFRIGCTAYAWGDPNAAITSGALLGQSDVAIAISHTGGTRDTIAALERARKSSATTIAITNYPRSRVAKIADHVLTTAARETTFRSGAMASRVAQLCVVDCLFAVVAKHDYAATLQALDRTRDAVSSRHLKRSGATPPT